MSENHIIERASSRQSPIRLTFIEQDCNMSRLEAGVEIESQKRQDTDLLWEGTEDDIIDPVEIY